MNKAQVFKEWIETDKHATGEHDQKTHGRRGGAAKVESDHDRLTAAGFEKMKGTGQDYRAEFNQAWLPNQRMRPGAPMRRFMKLSIRKSTGGIGTIPGKTYYYTEPPVGTPRRWDNLSDALGQLTRFMVPPKE